MSLIGIIDYGMGNILSVKNAVESLGAEVRVCAAPEQLEGTDKLILPGVGAFGDCVFNLASRGFTDILHNLVLKQKKPILGICLGMQVMARKGFENGKHDGLGWFNADTVILRPVDTKLRIPHVGWNNIEFKKESFLFKGITENPDFYFLHSYYMNCQEKDNVIAYFDYGGSFPAAVQKGNIVATQFHPEKSQDYGLKVLNNFVSWDSA